MIMTQWLRCISITVRIYILFILLKNLFSRNIIALKVTKDNCEYCCFIFFLDYNTTYTFARRVYVSGKKNLNTTSKAHYELFYFIYVLHLLLTYVLWICCVIHMPLIHERFTLTFIFCIKP